MGVAGESGGRKMETTVLELHLKKKNMKKQHLCFNLINVSYIQPIFKYSKVFYPGGMSPMILLSVSPLCFTSINVSFIHLTS